MGKENTSPYLINVVLDDLTIDELEIPILDRSVFSKTIEILSEADVHSIACDMIFQGNMIGEQDNALDEKIAWLRQLLEWKDEVADASDFVDQIKSEVEKVLERLGQMETEA